MSPWPPQLVAQKLDKQTKPVASPGYSTKLTSVDFAVYCSYRFSAASMLNIVFYDPAHPVAELSGKKVLALGLQHRLRSCLGGHPVGARRAWFARYIIVTSRSVERSRPQN